MKRVLLAMLLCIALPSISLAQEPPVQTPPVYKISVRGWNVSPGLYRQLVADAQTWPGPGTMVYRSRGLLSRHWFVVEKTPVQ